MRRVRDELAAEMEAMRRLMSSLRPPVIDERGIVHALRECAGDVLRREVAFQVESTVEDDLDREIETVVYRIVREALLNVDKHSQARRVDVTLSRRDDELVLSIRDDGRGFDAWTYATTPERYPGLMSMRELAESLGGSTRVTSGRDAGTEVRAVVPLGARAALRQAAQPGHLDRLIPRLVREARSPAGRAPGRASRAAGRLPARGRGRSDGRGIRPTRRRRRRSTAPRSMFSIASSSDPVQPRPS